MRTEMITMPSPSIEFEELGEMEMGRLEPVYYTLSKRHYLIGYSP